MAEILLERFNYGFNVDNAVSGTFGRMYLPSGQILYTCERPWMGNQPSVSCIPEGEYTLLKRESPVVVRSTDGKYIEGWEVCEVPGRTYIMIHPANWPHQLQGCISVGVRYTKIMDKLGVSHSRDAFDIFMSTLSGEDSHRLVITHFEP